MALKRWILNRMHRMHDVVGRPDLRPPADPDTVAKRGSGSASRPSVPGAYDVREGSAMRPDQLGAYAPLVAAVRDELLHFATTQLRLHLAIAERDRYLLAAIEVECVDGSEGDDLLRRFTREFTPEQVKRFIARGVIAQLPNASAIDLSQFAGLNPPPDQRDDGHEAYADLIAQLRSASPVGSPRSFEVRLIGRWTEGEGTEASPAAAGVKGGMRTPMSGVPLEVEIEDASGRRTSTIAGVVPRRRYAIGKGEGCDVRVEGAYASRRHCEVWLEHGRWWAADAGSTNGIRVELAQRVLARDGGPSRAAEAARPIEVVPGACIVLSALATGAASDYPRIALSATGASAVVLTPLARAVATPPTPVTPPAQGRATPERMSLTVTTPSGVRSVPLTDDALPLRIGRSRNQDVVIDWSHEGVSGRHVEISQFDATGAEVEVHGDNGVSVAGVTHAAGQRFRWRVDEPMTLGCPFGGEPACTLMLARQADR